MVDNYPWTTTRADRDWPSLLHLRPEDVGYDAPSANADAASAATAAQVESLQAAAHGEIKATDPLVRVYVDYHFMRLFLLQWLFIFFLIFIALKCKLYF